jgi:hypothetical protein
MSSKKELLERSSERKKRKRVGRLIFWIFIFLLLTGIASYILVSPALAIRSIAVQGNSVLEDGEISGFITEATAGRYLYFFPKSSILLYPREQIEKSLLEKFPRLLSAQLSLADWDAVLANVKERDTDAIWCSRAGTSDNVSASSSVSGTSSPAESADCYFTDQGGYIFAPAPTFTGSAFIELRGSLKEPAIGGRPLSERSYGVVSRFARYLPEIFKKTVHDNYRLLYVRIIDGQRFEAEIADTGSALGSWKIVFDGEENADIIAENLFSIIESPAFKKDMIDHKSALDSIDLRYGKKIYYKFK